MGLFDIGREEMTLDEAIKHAEEVAEVNFDRAVRFESAECGRCASEHRQLAEWLQELKSYNSIKTELKLCEDCISREDALMALTGEWTDSTDELIHRFIRRIKTLPPVNSQSKIGHWEWVQYDSNPNIGNWHCSECRCVVIEYGDKKSKGDIPLYKYCPQCGCRMVEPQESEESE